MKNLSICKLLFASTLALFSTLSVTAESLAPTPQFPCRSAERPGIKLYKDLYSGTSMTWFSQHVEKMGKASAKKQYSNLSFMTGAFSENEKIIYGCVINMNVIPKNKLIEKFKKEYTNLKITDKRNAEDSAEAGIFADYIDAVGL